MIVIEVGVRYELLLTDGEWIRLNVNANRSSKGDISSDDLRKIDVVAQSNHTPIEFDSDWSDFKVDDLKDSEIKDFIIELLSR
jgi:hypothetical protein